MSIPSIISIWNIGAWFCSWISEFAIFGFKHIVDMHFNHTHTPKRYKGHIYSFAWPPHHMALFILDPCVASDERVPTSRPLVMDFHYHLRASFFNLFLLLSVWNIKTLCLDHLDRIQYGSYNMNRGFSPKENTRVFGQEKLKTWNMMFYVMLFSSPNIDHILSVFAVHENYLLVPGTNF